MMLMTETTTPTAESRGLTVHEAVTITRLAVGLPGWWRMKMEMNEDGEIYAGLISPKDDPQAFQFILSGQPNETFGVTDWTGHVVAEGVSMGAAFGAIRGALAG